MSTPMNPQLRDAMMLAKELQLSFITDMVSKAIKEYEDRPGPLSLVNLKYWNGILNLHFIIKELGYDHVCKAYSEYKDAMSFYTVIKQ